VRGFHHLRVLAIFRHGETALFVASWRFGAAVKSDGATHPPFFTGSWNDSFMQRFELQCGIHAMTRAH
jgi:hypothetical protein